MHRLQKMKKVKKVKIVKLIYSSSLAEFEKKINEALNDGWILYGNMTHVYSTSSTNVDEAFSQIMVK